MTAPPGPPEYGPLVGAAHLGSTVKAFRDRPRSLSALLSAAARRWPERAAVVAPAGTLTFAGLDRAVSAAAAGLRARGVGPGDRVAVVLAHDLALYALPFLASRAGCLALLLSAAHPPERWAAQLRSAGVCAAVVDTTTATRAGAALAGGVTLLDSGELFSSPAAPPPQDDRLQEDTPVVALPTSGTTGVPKTTLVTSRGLIHAALAYTVLLGLGTDRRSGEAAPERTLVVLPLHSIGPLSAQVTAMALVGGTCVLPADASPAAARRPLAEHAITHLDAVPAWLTLYARLPEPAPLPALRTIIYGGAPMPAGTAAALALRHPGCALYDVWGLSETHGPVTALRLQPAAPAPPGTVGWPIAGVEVRVGGAGPDGVGELEVRGANVTPGYLDDPVTSAAVLADGWLRTGDVGALAADGSLRILDRAKDVILRGGASVFSVEVEQVLSGAPGVAEAAVYAVADSVGGEAVAAAVVLAPGAVLDAGGLRRRVRTEIGGHAVPRHIAAVAALPRNLTGKVDKRRLREEAQ